MLAVAEIVLFDGVEKVVIPYLQNQLDMRGKTVRVATKIDNPRTPVQIRIRVAGGSGSNPVLSSRTVIFECYSPNSSDAEDLAELAFAIMKAARFDSSVPAIRNVTVIGAPVSFPDPDTTLPRYQFTLGILLRGTPA